MPKLIIQTRKFHKNTEKRRMKKSEGFVKVGGGSTTGKLGVTWGENKLRRKLGRAQEKPGRKQRRCDILCSSVCFLLLDLEAGICVCVCGA